VCWTLIRRYPLTVRCRSKASPASATLSKKSVPTGGPRWSRATPASFSSTPAHSASAIRRRRSANRHPLIVLYASRGPSSLQCPRSSVGAVSAASASSSSHRPAVHSLRRDALPPPHNPRLSNTTSVLVVTRLNIQNRFQPEILLRRPPSHHTLLDVRVPYGTMDGNCCGGAAMEGICVGQRGQTPQGQQRHEDKRSDRKRPSRREDMAVAGS
jgi:hypothetical protein